MIDRSGERKMRETLSKVATVASCHFGKDRRVSRPSELSDARLANLGQSNMLKWVQLLSMYRRTERRSGEMSVN
jgi:hypothetical protein